MLQCTAFGNVLSLASRGGRRVFSVPSAGAADPTPQGARSEQTVGRNELLRLICALRRDMMLLHNLV